MTSRRLWIPALLIAATMHAWGVARSTLPAQDGLKFIRIARGFQTRPWLDVIRGTEQHPLYPAGIALVQPVVAAFTGDTPEGWRVSAQVVSILASLALLIPLRRVTARMFGDDAANLCLFMFVLLPVPAALGRDTLSDALGMLCLLTALDLAQRGLIENKAQTWVYAGLAAGIGYLARPEVVLIGLSAGVAAAWSRLEARRVEPGLPRRLVVAGWMVAAALLPIGGYALAKGAISEKLALRTSVALAPAAPPKSAETTVAPPKGLDDHALDFSAKEETGKSDLAGRPGRVARRLLGDWTEGIGFLFAVPAILGLIFVRPRDEGRPSRRLILIHAILFTLIVVKMSTKLGYLSGRHAMTLVLLALPFAAAGLHRWASGFPARRGIGEGTGRVLAGIGLCGLVAIGVTVQAKGMHESRGGHRSAGEWLIAHASPDEAVLDTRGWATFVRRGAAYDYWHVKQALADPKLRYVVVGRDELSARSPRAATLNALLAKAGTRAATFGGEGREAEVLVYRFDAPRSWEGLTR